MPSLWFVMPVSGRLQLAAICMRQLRRTCDALCAEGVEATCVVIGDDENLATARDLGFGVVRRNNNFVSRKFNDGIQLALDPRHNPRPADYVVPIGSDDWVDHSLFLDLPGPDTMVGFRRIAFVREDGREMKTKELDTVGGSGIRIYPRRLMTDMGYRPANEDKPRGCDTSIRDNLMRQHSARMKVDHRYHHDYQIVDWKTAGEQLNTYRDLDRHRGKAVGDPFVQLVGFYPAEALEEMRAHYGVRELAAA